MKRITKVENELFKKDKVTILSEELADIIGPLSTRKDRVKWIKDFFKRKGIE